MIKSILYILVSFFGTGVNFWVFSKVFPRKEQSEPIRLLPLICYYVFVMFFASINIVRWTGISFFTMALISAGVAGVYIIIRKYAQKSYALVFVNRAVEYFLMAATAGLFAVDNWYGFISTGAVVIFSVAIPLLLMEFRQCSYWQGAILEMLYLSVLTLLKEIYFVYVSVIDKILWDANTKLHTYGAIIYLLILYAGIIVFVKCFTGKKLLKKLLIEYKKETFLTAIGILILCELVLIFQGQGYNVNSLVGTILVVIGLLIGLLYAIAYSVWKSSETQKNFLNMRNQIMEQQYVELRKAYEQNRCIIHDEKHMINYLTECLSSGEVQKAQEFLGVCSKKRNHDSGKFWTGFPTLDFMLNMKKREMDGLSITFSLETDFERMPLNDADFVMLLGNLFDNAIEAAQQCALPERRIKLILQNANDMFLLHMENTCVREPDKKNGRFLTTKRDEKKHGWGIESVKHIVSKHNGEIFFEFAEDVFCVKIVIKMEQ
ncbi:MAG: ATP-binding protein [Eubacteriales bacterium]|nr:ATP-binding protein [Eubacteriales bacterium]